MDKICIFADDTESFFQKYELAFSNQTIIKFDCSINTYNGTQDVMTLLERHKPIIGLILVPDVSFETVANLKTIFKRGQSILTPLIFMLSEDIDMEDHSWLNLAEDVAMVIPSGLEDSELKELIDSWIQTFRYEHGLDENNNHIQDLGLLS